MCLEKSIGQGVQNVFRKIYWVFKMFLEKSIAF